MKQTNNAIKFLMAQYRAIFKQAYIKGLVSAVVLTTGLAAAGTASATTLLENDSQFKDDATQAKDVVISDTQTLKLDKNKFAKTVTIKSGGKLTVNLSGSSVSLRTQGITIEAGGELIASGSGSKSAHLYGGAPGSITSNLTLRGTAPAESSAATLTFTDAVASFAGIDAKGAIVSLTSSADEANLWAQGKGTTWTDGSGADYKAGDLTTAVAAFDNSKITLTAGGTSKAVLGSLNELAIKGSEITLSGSGGAVLEAYNLDNDNKGLSLTDSTTLNVSGSDTKASLLSSQIDISKSKVVVASGASLTFGQATKKDFPTVEPVEPKPAEFNVVGSTVENAGTIIVAEGNLKVDDASTLQATKEGAEIQLSGSGSILTLSADKLKSYLTEEAGVKDDKKGKLVLNDKSTLDLGKSSVNLNDFTFTSGDAAAGNIKVASGNDKSITVKAGDMLVATELDVNNLTLEAGNLELGNSEQNGADIAFKSATAKNVKFVSKDGFVLNNDLTLRNTRDVTVDKDTVVVVGDAGTISGKMTVSGGKTLKVDGGVYTASDVITLKSGSLIVENAKKADKSTLTLNGLVLDSTVDNTVTADGKLSEKYAPEKSLTHLDLTNGVQVTGTGDKKTTFTAKAGGIISFAGDNLSELMNDHAKNILIKTGENGILHVDGTLKVGVAGAKNAEANKYKAGMLQLGSGSDVYINSLVATQALTDAEETDLKSNTYGFGYKGVTFHLEDMTFNNTSTSGEKAIETAYILDGTYNISKSFTSDNKKLSLIQIASGNGYEAGGVALNFETDAPDLTGQINMGAGGVIELTAPEASAGNAARTAVTFTSGKWSAAGVTFDVKGGTMTVGGDDTASVLTADGLAVSGEAEKSTVTINDTGVATFNTLKQTGGKITVNGTLTVNGKAPTSDAPADFGVALNDVTVGGNLNFGDNATKGIVTVKDGAVTVNDGAKDKLTLNDNGEVALSLSGTLTLDSVKQLKKDLFTGESFIGSEDNGTLKGFINLGQASIGVKPDASGNIAWDDFKPVSDITGVTTDALKGATVTGVTSSAQFKGSVGSVQTAAGNNTVNVTGNTALNKANGNGLFAAEADGKTAASVSVSGVGTDLRLVGSGAVKDVNLADGTSLTTAGKGDISVNAIKGKGDLVLDSNVTVADRVEGKSLTSTAGTTLTAKSITVSGADSFVEGNLKVAGDARFDGEMVELFGTNEIGGDLTLGSTGTGKWSGIYGDTTLTNAAGKVTFNNSGEIGDGALLTAHTVTMAQNSHALYVGEEESIEPGTDKTNPSTTGYLQVNGNLKLNGKYLVVDPAYGLATSVAAVKSFTEQINTDIKAAGGKLDGDVVLGRNGALMVGANATVEAAKSLIERYQVNGSLVSPEDDGVGAVMIVDSRTVVEGGKRIILDPSRSGNEIIGHGDFFDGKGVIKTAYNGTTGAYANKEADLYLGKGSVLHFTDNVLAEADTVVNGQAVKGAIHFDKTDAAIKGEAGAKIVLGDAYLNTSGIVLFTDNGNTVTGRNTAGDGTGVLVMDNDIRVESLNGLMFFTLKAGEETSAQNLSLDYNRIDRAFLEASVPVRDSLLQYASGTMNYEEFFEPVGENGTPVEQEKVLGNVATGHKVNAEGQIVDANGAVVKNPDLFIVVSEKDDEGNVVNTVYHKPSNAFLANVTQKTQGRDADLLARLAAFGGTAQAALTASSLTSDAVAGRMGMGAAAGSITFADNGQGAGMWISPVYRNHDSDGFKAQGLNYGVDMDLTGVAIGGDFTTASGIRFGAAFNLGTGDAKGQGAGDGVKNDFDYVGFSIYGGYSAGALSVVGDVSYTVVDNDLEAHTSVEKVKASADSKALSVGVTGTYAFDLSGVTVAPHAGVRYTSIDVDDFAYDGEATGRIGEYKGDSLNVFSIPVGVTVSKDIVAGSWTVKPSFDLTLTANTGDDSVDGKVQWSGVSNMQTAVQSEVIDSFTYGATIGVSAKSGNLSFGAGLNYTGSSNADEFGVNANARFVF